MQHPAVYTAKPSATKAPIKQRLSGKNLDAKSLGIHISGARRSRSAVRREPRRILITHSRQQPLLGANHPRRCGGNSRCTREQPHFRRMSSSVVTIRRSVFLIALTRKDAEKTSHRIKLASAFSTLFGTSRLTSCKSSAKNRPMKCSNKNFSQTFCRPESLRDSCFPVAPALLSPLQSSAHAHLPPPPARRPVCAPPL